MTPQTGDLPSSLRRIQQWMQSVITHPDGVPAGIDSDPAREQFGPVTAEAIATRSRSLSAEERLGVYHNAYFARLLACLREEFPILVKTLGDDVFDAFAFGYLQRFPSHSYTLGRLAADFARYLAETHTEEADGIGGPLSFEEFVIDLAALEWAYGEVFDGPGVEDEQPLDSAALSRIPADLWPTARLVPVPCLRLMALRFPVHRYHAEARKTEDAPIPAPSPTFVAITRQDYTVSVVELSADEHALLTSLVSGQTVAEAIDSLTSGTSLAMEELPQLLEGWFRRWASECLFRDVRFST